MAILLAQKVKLQCNRDAMHIACWMPGSAYPNPMEVSMYTCLLPGRI